MTSDFIHEELKDYEDFRYRINEIFFDEVMEADSDTSVEDNDNPEKTLKFKERVDKLIKQITAIIDRAFTKIANIFMRIAQTTDGFDKEFRDRYTKVKPLEAIKLIAYDYDDAFLEQQMTKIHQTVFNLLGNFKTEHGGQMNKEDNPMNFSATELIQSVLKEAGAPDDVTDINLYFTFLKKSYRREKKEQLFKGSESKKYYTFAVESDTFEGKITMKKQIMKNQVSSLKAILNQVILDKTAPTDKKQRALKYATNLSHLFNFYASFLNIYCQLRFEKCFSYRAVLKKLYRM